MNRRILWFFAFALMFIALCFVWLNWGVTPDDPANQPDYDCHAAGGPYSDC